MATAQPLTFGELLKRYRLAADLTQEALAERAGVSARSVSDLERGLRRRAPYRDTITRLAAALQLSTHEHTLFAAAARRRAAPVPLLPGRRPPAPHHGTASTPFVGRGRELGWVEHHLTGEGPPVLLLAGEPGIGKTRLLREVVGHAWASGWTVLEGGCQRRAGQDPYAPLLDGLARHMARQPVAQLRGALQGCAWLVRLLPELAERAVVPVPAWTLPAEQERRLMFAAVGRYLANVAGAAGTLLVLDDLQWAGVDALDLLESVVRAAEAPLRVLGAYRDTEVVQASPLGHLLADLARETLATSLALGPLPVDAAQQLCEDVLARVAAPMAARSAIAEHLLRQTGGVPFYVVSCAQAWLGGDTEDLNSTGGGEAEGAERGAVGTSLEAAAGVGVPWTVAQHIRQRAAALPEVGQELLWCAAMIGRQSPSRLLMTVTEHLGWSEREVLMGLDAACQARLLENADADGFQFTHDLVREVLEADLSMARRAVMHRRIAEALEAEPGEPAIEQLAYHHARSGAPDKAIPYLERAGDRARALHANRAAEEYYRELVIRLEQLGEQTAKRAPAYKKLGIALLTLARLDEALSRLKQAAEAYGAVSDLEGQRQCLAHVGETYAAWGRPRDGIGLLQPLADSLVASNPTPSLAALQAALAHLYWVNGQQAELLEAAERAAALAEAVADEALLVTALHWRSLGLLAQGRVDEALGAIEHLVPLAEEAGDLAVLSRALNNTYFIHQRRGKLAQGGRYIERAVEVAEQSENPALLGFMAGCLGEHLFLCGAWDEAGACYERSAALARDLQSWIVRYTALGLGILGLARGHGDEAVHRLETCIALAEQRGDLGILCYAHGALAEHELVGERPDVARAHLAPLLDRVGQQGSDVIPLLPLVAWSALDLGDEARAADVLVQCLAQAGAEPNCLALVDAQRVQALLAIRRGCWHEAEEILEETLARCQAMPYPYAEAKALSVYGQLHMGRDEPERARAKYEAALAICQRLGEGLYRPHIEQALGELEVGGG